ncbi:MAG: histidinol dehydrogenase [Calditrichaeota bacterium]|nr:MAG: histidinol dehydrogenase [Calditrichota bacterium]
MNFFHVKNANDLKSLVQSFQQDGAVSKSIFSDVQKILLAVKNRGDAACVEFTEKFDGVKLSPEMQEIDKDTWQKTASSINSDLQEALQFAAKNIQFFHEKQKQSSWEINRDGVILGQRIVPIERVGVYIPGGRAKYPSTVLMTAIPAKIAGVDEIIMVSPPDRETGTIDPVLLYAANLAGVDRVFKCGGAQAVAALAYGTDCIPHVDKIVGPGNAYVAEAKRQVFGTVGIDLIAGPSEVAILVDEQTKTEWIVQDLFAQMEHDPLTRCLIVSLCADKADEIIQLAQNKLHSAPRSAILQQAWVGSTTVTVVENKEVAIEILNGFAAEHLEIMTANPREILPEIKHAGAIFLGQFSPVPMGDYVAGPNHTLPTNSTARFASALGVYDFVRHQDIIEYDEESWQREARFVDRLAQAEELPNHALSAMARNRER